jgi:hypothetical protein
MPLVMDNGRYASTLPPEEMQEVWLGSGQAGKRVFQSEKRHLRTPQNESRPGANLSALSEEGWLPYPH